MKNIMKKQNLILFTAVMIMFFAAQGKVQAATCAWDGSDSSAWTLDANWVDGTAPISTDDVVIDGNYTNAPVISANVTVANLDIGENNVSVLSFTQGTAADLTVTGTLNVYANGMITCPYASLSVPDSGGSGRTITAGTLTVEGNINADGLGFPNDQGPGKPTSGSNDGGGYGGIGGDDSGNGPTSSVYGSVTAPISLGSGGDAKEGGGAITFNVTGATTINGIVSANGIGSSSGGYASGAGGSIYITTGSISGIGTIQAKGGSTPYRASGGGGRIAIILSNPGENFDGFTGSVIASGGGSVILDAPRDGAAGTVYKETEAQESGYGELIIDNNDEDYTHGEVNTPMPTSTNFNNFSAITIRNKGNLAITSDDTFDFSAVNIQGEGAGEAFITIVDDTGVTFPNPFSIAGHTLNLDGVSSATGDWTVTSTGALSHSRNTKEETFKINFNLTGNLTIDSGGEINVKAMGYMENFPISLTNQDGASHGGIGGDKNADGVITTTYGSITAPTNIGAAGVNDYGGGSATIVVSGSATVNGAINADGRSASAAGGSIYLTIGTISGTGFIHADGADPGSAGYGGGGGGRISIVLTGASADFSSFSGSITAYGGNSSTATRDGAAGTVYLEEEADATGDGELIIANFTDASVASGVTTLISSSVTDTAVGDVTISNTGIFDMAADTTLTVSGSWTNSATSTLTAGAITLDSTGSETITAGGGAFYNLTFNGVGGSWQFQDTQDIDGAMIVTNGTIDFNAQTLAIAGNLTMGIGSQVVSDADAMNGTAITVGGDLSLEGEDGDLLTFNATSSWTLSVTGSATATYVAVAYSDASGGTEIDADDGTNTDNNNNINWDFIGFQPPMAPGTIKIKGSGIIRGRGRM